MKDESLLGAVDDWLREHTVLHTTTGACDPNENSLVEESVGARKRGVRCLLHQAKAPVCLWPDAAEHANEVYNHSKRPVLGQSEVLEPIVAERHAFSGQAECDLLPRENPFRGHPGVVWHLRSNKNIPQCVGEVWTPSICKEFLSVGTGECHSASKLRPFAMTKRLRK